jgi:Zn-dependent protease
MDSARVKCADCGQDVAPGFQACPTCGRLVHSETLKKLAAQASAAEQAGDFSAALSSWRDTLDLLPPDSRQHAEILKKVQTLSAQFEEGASPPKASVWKKGAAGLGGAALLLFKFKNILLIALTKGKFLLLGLTKLPTLLSMLAWVGVYWTLWGWKFALGMGVSIYIHEMGHVWMLRRYGIRATAPMFIPGFGALVRLQQYPATVIEDARIGLAGPLWGLGAAAASWGIYLATGHQFWGALAQFGAMINLFNLIPVWQLDGGRGFRSLTKGQRWLAALAVWGMFYFTSETAGHQDGHQLNVFLLIIGFCSVGRALFGEAPKQRDDFGLFQYVLLIMVLGWLAAVDLPIHG